MSPLPCINVTFPKVKLTFVNVTVKNVTPAIVKLYALKAGLLLLWVFPWQNSLFCFVNAFKLTLIVSNASLAIF